MGREVLICCILMKKIVIVSVCTVCLHYNYSVWIVCFCREFLQKFLSGTGVLEVSPEGLVKRLRFMQLNNFSM
jgi:hypothetical protein